MSLVRCNDVSLHFGDQVIFDHAEFTLEAGERVCLVGRNGAGKSTLFRLLTGAIVPDSGAIVRRADVRVSELEQGLPDTQERTVRDWVADGIAAHEALIARYHALTAGTLAATDLHELEDLQRQIEVHGGWDTSAQIGAVLSELELPPDKRLAELSGGWQRRVALARALVSRPDILLLDEPTNHLDLTAIEWLERHVRGFRGTVLFITHDRAFLRALATRILDLDRGRLRSWPGDYDKYLELKEQTLTEEAQAHALFDKKLAEEERWIRQGIKARRTRNEGRVRALERMRAEYARRTRQEGRARIELEEAAQSSRRVIRARHLHHAFGDHVVLNDLTLDIMRGDRVGLLGNNGVGKSTLLRILLGEITPDGGTVTRGENLVMGYFDQRRRDLDPSRTVADIVGDGRDYVTIGGRQRHVIGYLQGFLFSARRAQTPVGYLSGGECNRVILARLFSQPSNLLVLDEPTNDLDVETLEVLEAELAEYQGTLLIVSHDRAFLDNVVTSTLVFEAPGVVTRYPGGYSDWLRQGRGLAASGAAAAPVPPAPIALPARDGGAPRGSPSPPRLSYKLRVELEQLPDRIEASEAAIAALEDAVATPGFYTRPYPEVQARLDELAAARTALDALMQRWDELETLSRQTR